MFIELQQLLSRRTAHEEADEERQHGGDRTPLRTIGTMLIGTAIMLPAALR